MSEPITRASLAALSPTEAAALWLVRKDQELPVEAGLFEEWLRASEAHERAWHAVEGAWALFDEPDDTDLADLRRAALADKPAARWYNVRENWRPAAAAAAAAIVVVAGGLELSRGSNPQTQVASETRRPDRVQVFEGAARESREFALADGTRMAVGPEALVRVSLATNHRQLALNRGSVTLAVAHDPVRPFEVTALDRRIVDIGTRFEVALEAGAMRVALFEGSVRVEGGLRPAILQPGQQLVARPGQRDVITRIAARDTGGEDLIQFDNVTLAAAAETINQGSVVKLYLPDPRVAQLRVSGRFRPSDAERFARSASVLLSLRVVRVSATRIELRRNR